MYSNFADATNNATIMPTCQPSSQEGTVCEANEATNSRQEAISTIQLSQNCAVNTVHEREYNTELSTVEGKPTFSKYRS